MQLKQEIVHLKRYILVKISTPANSTPVFSYKPYVHFDSTKSKHAVVQLEVQVCIECDMNSCELQTSCWTILSWTNGVINYQPPAVSRLPTGITGGTSDRHQKKSSKFISLITLVFTKDGIQKKSTMSQHTNEHTHTHSGSRKLQTGRSSHCHTATGR